MVDVKNELFGTQEFKELLRDVVKEAVVKLQTQVQAITMPMTQAANFPGAEVTSAHEGPQPPRKRRRIVPDNIDDTREPQVELTDGMCMQIKELRAEFDECCRHLYECSRICVQRKRASIK